MNKEHFRMGFDVCWGAMYCIALFTLLGMSLTYLFTSADNCDKSKWDRCGLAVKVDSKTGIEYLITPQGGIIQRGKNN